MNNRSLHALFAILVAIEVIASIVAISDSMLIWLAPRLVTPKEFHVLDSIFYWKIFAMSVALIAAFISGALTMVAGRETWTGRKRKICGGALLLTAIATGMALISCHVGEIAGPPQ